MTDQEVPMPQERREGERRSGDRRHAPPSNRSSSKIWLTLSVALSVAILGWGFSLPFRNHDRPLLLWDESDIPRAPGSEVRKVRLSADEANAYRAAAIKRDREFLRQRRDRIRRNMNRDVPGAEQAEIAKHERVQSLKKTIKQLKDAPDESLAAKYRDELKESISKETPQ